MKFSWQSLKFACFVLYKDAHVETLYEKRGESLWKEAISAWRLNNVLYIDITFYI